MPSRIIVLVALGVLACCLACPGAEFYVAPDGNDSNAGTKDKPFGSPVAARNAVRKLIAAGLKEDVRVLLAGGTYYLPEGLTFGPADSGTEKFRITYRPAGEGTPVLVGGAKVTGLKPYRGQILVAPLPAGAKSKVASEDGVRLTLARGPNEGYGSVARPGGAGFSYSGDDLQALAGADCSDGMVNVWDANNWFDHLYDLKSIDPQSRQIALSRDVATKKGGRFYVFNVLGLLDKPGECVISPKEGKFYVWPLRAPAGERTYAVATAENVIAIRGAEGKPVRNLHVEGLDLTLANDDAVLVTAAEDCTLRGCLIANAWQRGVYIRGAAQRITVADSEIRAHGLHGVEIKGAEIGGPDINKGHRIENNHIHHCGVIVGHGHGVVLCQSGHNQVIHNHIHHTPRYGTGVKGLTLPFIKDPKVRANKFEYLHARNNVLAYNHIHHVCLDSQDTGAMQSWGPGRDNVYDHNLIHDVGNGQFMLQSGIYLDDDTDYFTVTHNVIYNVTGRGHTQTIYAKGIGNKIDNNVLIVSPACGAAIRSKRATATYNHHYTRNIVVFENRGAAIYQFDDYTGRRVDECDNNVYFNPGGGYRIAGKNPYGGNLGAWQKEFDKHSLTADPLFVDAARHDYRLRPDSPALKLGIKSTDISQAGLTDQFPKRLARE